MAANLVCFHRGEKTTSIAGKNTGDKVNSVTLFHVDGLPATTISFCNVNLNATMDTSQETNKISSLASIPFTTHNVVQEEREDRDFHPASILSTLSTGQATFTQLRSEMISYLVKDCEAVE